MNPTRSESNYFIQSNGSGPRNSDNKSKRQECHPRGEAQMADARTSTSSPRLARAFETLIESPEAEITAISIVRPKPFPTRIHIYIPVSVKELVYGGKAEGVGTSSKSLDKHHELISSSEELHWTKKRCPSEGFDNHVLKRTSPTNKSFVENPKNFVRG
ncbi:hypothetical protein O181_066588 [Austropuccinia psidii MF-1]|uniref:Uncharacterized protein n=1 Tax=Austropuccinia psidii MF-1 TaxID=1389203 RepID=A0A9Q3EXD5_9BASI|nr:hypothetical protein [Austropuccinia psidii MF-1]